MASTELLSLLHISDLHVGVPPSYAGGAPTQWRHLSFCDGWLGHDERALVHLEDFVIDQRDAARHLLITGDFTACGHASEFQAASQYVQASIKVASRRVGLRNKQVMKQSIPGNHDHWPGSVKVLGTSSPALAKLFPMLPFAPYQVSLGNGLTLTVTGINSDADVWPHGPTRLFARGRFVSQLTALQGLLGPPDHEEIRVLLVHHSPSWPGKVLGIADDSAKALWAFVERYGVSVILTGHIHVPIGRIRTVTHKGTRWEVLEARCGTTTQTDEMPLNWVAAGTNDPDRFPLNSLLLHRLVDHGSRVDWEVDLYWRRHAGFDRPTALTRAITVWPR